jgi:hypothetical protein
MQPGELVASRGGPVVVAILGEELTRVGVERRAVRRRRARAPCLLRGPLEAVDVDVGDQVQRLVTGLDRAGAEHAPGDVRGLLEVVERGARIPVRPERVHRLLPVQPVPG